MELGFYLKKFISFFLEPLGLILTLLLVGLFYLYTKRETRAKFFLLLSLFLFILCAYPPFSNYLVKGLEHQYHKYNYKEKVEYIHVLGSGHNTDYAQPISSQISDAGVKRVLEGVIIHKNIPNSKIIFTGYKGKTEVSNAVMNAKLAVALGVSKTDLIINPLPKDTKEEALFTKTIVGNKAFVLVTSASHMPRAMILFRSLGMHPIAAPTNFYAKETQSYFQLPDISSFYRTTIALHEYVGMLWAEVKNIVKGN